jgi:hypothetical protein
MSTRASLLSNGKHADVGDRRERQQAFEVALEQAHHGTEQSRDDPRPADARAGRPVSLGPLLPRPWPAHLTVPAWIQQNRDQPHRT